MRINTTRFGDVEVTDGDILHFPAGLLGLEHCRQWVLLADKQNELLAWLQSTSRPEIALAVVNPRRFVTNYQARVYRSELSPLGLEAEDQPQVLVVVGKTERSVTLNLKGPLVINLRRRLGRQVIVNGDEPTQYELTPSVPPLRKIA